MPLPSDNLLLEKLPYQFGQLISDEAIGLCPSPQFLFEQTLDGLIMALKGFVLAEKLAEESVDETVRFTGVVVHEEPAGPWQMMKRTLWERRGTSNGARRYRLLYWLLAARHPVRYRRVLLPYDAERTFTLTTKQYAAFPQSAIKTPEAISGPLAVRYERVDVHAR